MDILICDDVNDAALQLKKIIVFSIPDANIAVFNSAEGTLEFIRSGKTPDVCFLDIIMPEMDGITLAARMRKEGYGGHIIFLTTANDYAAQSYKVNAFSYLLKPPNKTDVVNILHKLENKLVADDSGGIPVKTKQMTKFVLFKDISHVEVIKHNVHFRQINGKEIVITAVFSEIIPKLLEDSRFARCHRSFVVNMDDIDYIQDDMAVMRSGKNIPISKSYLDLKQKYSSRLFLG